MVRYGAVSRGGAGVLRCRLVI